MHFSDFRLFLWFLPTLTILYQLFNSLEEAAALPTLFDLLIFHFSNLNNQCSFPLFLFWIFQSTKCNLSLRNSSTPELHGHKETLPFLACPNCFSPDTLLSLPQFPNTQFAWNGMRKCSVEWISCIFLQISWRWRQFCISVLGLQAAENLPETWGGRGLERVRSM